MANPSEMLSIASCKPILRRHADDDRLVQFAVGTGDRFQGLFQFARAISDHAVEQNSGLKQMIGIALQVEAVLDALHQGAVDFPQLGDFSLQRSQILVGRRDRLRLVGSLSLASEGNAGEGLAHMHGAELLAIGVEADDLVGG